MDWEPYSPSKDFAVCLKLCGEKRLRRTAPYGRESAAKCAGPEPGRAARPRLRLTVASCRPRLEGMIQFPPAAVRCPALPGCAFARPARGGWLRAQGC